MCLPFCCGNDDHGSPSQGAGTGMKTTPDHPGQTEQAIPSSTGNGKGSQEGNGASQNKKGGDFNGGNTDSPPPPPPPPPSTPPPPTPPPTLAPQFPEDWAAEQTGTSTTPPGQAPEHKPPPPVQASKHRDPKMVVESPEHRDPVFTKSTPATKGPKQLEHVIAAGTLRTPPSPQIARRGREDNSPTVPAPAASNGLGDRGHDDDNAYGGKDDRRPPGKSWC
ncbi:hypothetical protein C2845_PM09G10510 [Panicum miliaceum]|uniref:Uncharacterized protein n=1 Tax=Panicum miliaceum TaxID=4540 RepID=A0A3L6RZ27_PANMI|nr:hypothetical protein C2845_PM09G10510 [Panicum miliaceum]